jgi:hypothetical protein
LQEDDVYKLDFTPDKNHISAFPAEERFGVCMQSVITTQRATHKDAWDDVIGLLKKLKSIATETKISDINTNYKLAPGGGVIELERGERSQLLQFIDAGLWNPLGLEAVRATKTWIDNLQEEDNKLKIERSSKR